MVEESEQICNLRLVKTIEKRTDRHIIEYKLYEEGFTLNFTVTRQYFSSGSWKIPLDPPTKVEVPKEFALIIGGIIDIDLEQGYRF